MAALELKWRRLARACQLVLGVHLAVTGCARAPKAVNPPEVVRTVDASETHASPPLKTITLIPFIEAGVPELDVAVAKLRLRFPRLVFNIEAGRALPPGWIVVRTDPRADQHGKRQVDGNRALATPYVAGRSVIGVTDRDLFTPEYNFLFANFEPDTSQAIVSVARFRTLDAPPGEPKETLMLASETSTELLFFQLVSSTAKVLGMSYACPVENCVLHFPWGTTDLRKKGTSFCEKHQKEFDAVMRGHVVPMSGSER